MKKDIVVLVIAGIIAAGLLYFVVKHLKEVNKAIEISKQPYNDSKG